MLHQVITDLVRFLWSRDLGVPKVLAKNLKLGVGVFQCRSVVVFQLGRFCTSCASYFI